MKRIRVMIVEPAGLLGGSERALLDLLSHIDQSQFEMTVVCPASSAFSDTVKLMGIPVIDAPLQLLHLRGRLARLGAIGAMARIVGRVRPDVVHVNQAGVLRMVALICRLMRVPLVCHVRLLEDARRLVRRRQRRLRPNAYIAVSNSVRQALGGTESLEGIPISLIYDPIDATAVVRESRHRGNAEVRSELAIPLEARIVALVGRVCRDKGQQLLIQAASVIGCPNYYYLIVGAAPVGDRSSVSFYNELKTSSAALGLESRVRFTGVRADVASLMSSSDAVVLASTEEAFGRVLLEALCLGRPIIGPAGGGPGEIIGKDERGLTFVPGSATSFASAIKATFADPEANVARTAQGQNWVNARCSPSTHARNLEKIYTELSGERRLERPAAAS